MAAQSAVSKLPVEFVRQPAALALRFKNRKKLPIHRLPFVDRVPDKVGLSFWAVPKTGGYSGGNETGAALARIYMKHLKEHGRGFGGGILQKIVLDMFDFGTSDDPEDTALSGQAVGFFFELELWLAGAAKYLEGGLDKQDNKTLLEAANAGLNFDNEAYMDSLSDEDEEE